MVTLKTLEHYQKLHEIVEDFLRTKCTEYNKARRYYDKNYLDNPEPLMYFTGFAIEGDELVVRFADDPDDWNPINELYKLPTDLIFDDNFYTIMSERFSELWQAEHIEGEQSSNLTLTTKDVTGIPNGTHVGTATIEGTKAKLNISDPRIEAMIKGLDTEIANSLMECRYFQATNEQLTPTQLNKILSYLQKSIPELPNLDGKTISYDYEAEIKIISFTWDVGYHTSECHGWYVLDFDVEVRVIGIEILDFYIEKIEGD